jgi:hypothetical protein
MKPALAPKDRDPMIEAGLLSMEKERPDPDSAQKIKEASGKGKKTVKAAGKAVVPGVKKGQVQGKPASQPKHKPLYRLRLTDKGRDYLKDHLSDPVSELAQNTGRIITFLLTRLSEDPDGKQALSKLLDNSVAFAPPKATVTTRVAPPPDDELPESQLEADARPKPAKTAPSPPKDQPPKEPKAPRLMDEDQSKFISAGGLLDAIKAFPRYLFMEGGGLRISVIKQQLEEFTHSSIDNALVHLESTNHVVLFPFDDPLRVNVHDQELALVVPGGVRHFVFIK